MSDEDSFKFGSGNFLKDRGYADPEQAREKFRLINDIALAIEDRRLSLAEAAEITGINFKPIDARWTATLFEKSISDLEDILGRFERPSPS